MLRFRPLTLEARRPRIQRFLHRLGDMLCAVFVDPGPVLEQTEVDKGLQVWCERNP